MQEDKGTVLLSQNEDGNTAQNPGIFCMPNRELAFPELQLKTFPAGQEAIPLAPHFSTTQRPPCVKGAVILPCKMTGGLTAGTPFIVSTPPSRLSPAHLPLHRGGYLQNTVGAGLPDGPLHRTSIEFVGVRCKKEDRSVGSVLNFSFFIFHFSLR